MKKLAVLSIIICLGTGVYAQPKRVILPENIKNVACIKKQAISESSNPFYGTTSDCAPFESFPEDEIGGTKYDLQSNASSPFGRLTMFDDGTFGAVWTRGMNPTAYLDRGTGYNYYNGSAWLPKPTARIESMRTGWPSIARLGSNGEVVIAHEAVGGLVMNRRTTKGDGTWEQSILPVPEGVITPWWSRVVSSGPDHNTIHVVVLTLPTGNGGLVYKGQDGALLYYRSTDAGNTWVDAGIQLPGTDSSYYTNFAGDSYSFVEPHGDKLAFIVCDPWNDMFIMRSDDNGATWNKTILWEHPYPRWSGEVTDTIYCPDGSAHGAFDSNGKLHIVFGVNREMNDADGASWFPFVDGVAYWNEDMPTWVGGDQLHCLNPDSLYTNGNLVGWMQDVDDDGVITLKGDLVETIAKYYLSPTSFPQIAFDSENNAILLFSSITETYDNGDQDYRHIWCRVSSNNGATWGRFIDLNDSPDHIFDECVFPVISARSTETEWSFIYQLDNEPGLSVNGDLDMPDNNYLYYYHVSKLLNQVDDPEEAGSLAVSETYPNPVHSNATIDVTLTRTMPIDIQVASITGQIVKQLTYEKVAAGLHKVKIDCSGFSKGVYFFSVNAGKSAFTRKLIVQ